MVFSLLILAPPYGSQAQQTALRFIRASLADGHRIYRVFFYYQAVQVANQLQCPPQDEVSLLAEWQRLARHNHIELCLCVASALKQGILNAEEAQRYEKHTANIAPAFSIVGLGQLIDAQNQSDRVITFAN